MSARAVAQSRTLHRITAQFDTMDELYHEKLPTASTPFFVYKNHAYKNVEGQITPKIKNIVVILLVAISISFPFLNL